MLLKEIRPNFINQSLFNLKVEKNANTPFYIHAFLILVEEKKLIKRLWISFQTDSINLFVVIFSPFFI